MVVCLLSLHPSHPSCLSPGLSDHGSKCCSFYAFIGNVGTQLCYLVLWLHWLLHFSHFCLFDGCSCVVKTALVCLQVVFVLSCFHLILSKSYKSTGFIIFSSSFCLWVWSVLLLQWQSPVCRFSICLAASSQPTHLGVLLGILSPMPLIISATKAIILSGLCTSFNMCWSHNIGYSLSSSLASRLVCGWLYFWYNHLGMMLSLLVGHGCNPLSVRQYVPGLTSVRVTLSYLWVLTLAGCVNWQYALSWLVYLLVKPLYTTWDHFCLLISKLEFVTYVKLAHFIPFRLT